MQKEIEHLRMKLNKMGELEEEDNSPLVSVMPNLACKSHSKKPDEYPITTTQKGIAMIASMRQWGREINQGI